MEGTNLPKVGISPLSVNFSNNKKKSKLDFASWFVGITDGDGTFHFSEVTPNKWIFYFKISQSSYNLRLLYYIKSNLGVGEVRVVNSLENLSKNMGEYRIRDRKLLLKHIIPLFEKTPLLTSKQYNFEKFKKALLISTNPNLSKTEKDNLLKKIKKEIRPENYLSPVWSKNKDISLENAKLIMNKSWIVGFTEAEGSFYLSKRDNHKISHGFEITQKLDKIVLTVIAKILNIKLTTKKTYNTVGTNRLKDIPNIISFYNKTMKGMKSLEFRIWSRSFNKMKKEKNIYIYLNKVQTQMRKIRSIRLDKNFKIYDGATD